MSTRLETDETRDLLREIAAVLIGLGASMWVLRTGSAAGAFASFCILAIPAALLLRMSLSKFPSERSAAPWQAVVSTVGLLLLVLSLRQLANWFGEPGDAANGINVFWVFGLGALVALRVARMSGARFQILLSCRLAGVSLAGFLDAVLDDGIAANFGVFRGSMFIFSLLLAGLGVVVLRSRGVGQRSIASATPDPDRQRVSREASEVFCGAASIAVFACGYGITSALGLIPTIAGVDSAGSGVVWEVLLLLTGIAAVAAGSEIGSRGLTWVGGIGLILFFYVVGLDVHSGERRPDSFGVWPALLLAVGAIFLLVSLSPQATRGRVFAKITSVTRSRARKR